MDKIKKAHIYTHTHRHTIRDTHTFPTHTDAHFFDDAWKRIDHSEIVIAATRFPLTLSAGYYRQSCTGGRRCIWESARASARAAYQSCGPCPYRVFFLALHARPRDSLPRDHTAAFVRTTKLRPRRQIYVWRACTSGRYYSPSSYSKRNPASHSSPS